MTYKPKPEDCQGTAVPHCPHCGHEIKDWWDGLDALKRDGDADETECGSCAKPFRIVIHVSHTFTTTIVPLPAEEAVADWNRKHPPGVPVTVRKDDLKYVDTHTGRAERQRRGRHLAGGDRRLLPAGPGHPALAAPGHGEGLKE